MKRAIGITALFFMSIAGCDMGQAHTKFGFNRLTGFDFSDTKNNNIKIARIGFNGSATSQPAAGYAEGIEITNNASEVNPTITALAKQHGENIIGVMSEVRMTLAQLQPVFELLAQKTPKGTSLLEELIKAKTSGVIPQP